MYFLCPDYDPTCVFQCTGNVWFNAGESTQNIDTILSDSPSANYNKIMDTHAYTHTHTLKAILVLQMQCNASYNNYQNLT